VVVAPQAVSGGGVGRVLRAQEFFQKHAAHQRSEEGRVERRRHEREECH